MTYRLVKTTGDLRDSTDRLWESGERQIAVIQRAFIFGRKIDVRVTMNQSTSKYTKCLIGKQWENSGTTPAMNVAIRENYKAFVGDIPNDFDFPDHPDNPVETVVLGPKATILSRGIPVSPDDLHSTMEGKTRLFMWGWAEYDDIFDGTPRHRTEFCNELITDGFEVPMERREITSRVYGRHNGFDEQCHRNVQTQKGKPVGKPTA